jgi:hypothetical protein
MPKNSNNAAVPTTDALDPRERLVEKISSMTADELTAFIILVRKEFGLPDAQEPELSHRLGA